MLIFQFPFSTYKKTITCKLAEIRNKRKISQEKIANAIHISVSFVSAIENQKKLPSLFIALSLAQFLEVSLDEVFQLQAQVKSQNEAVDFEKEVLEMLKKTQPKINWEDSFQYRNDSNH